MCLHLLFKHSMFLPIQAESDIFNAGACSTDDLNVYLNVAAVAGAICGGAVIASAIASAPVSAPIAATGGALIGATVHHLSNS